VCPTFKIKIIFLITYRARKHKAYTAVLGLEQTTLAASINFTINSLTATKSSGYSLQNNVHEYFSMAGSIPFEVCLWELKVLL